MPRRLLGTKELTCFDCGSTAEDGDLSASRFGGDPVCASCEAIRATQARTHGLAAVVVDTSTLILMYDQRSAASYG